MSAATSNVVMDFAEKLKDLANAILDCDEPRVMALIDEVGIYIRRLELTLKKLHKDKKDAEAKCEELQRLCQFHYNNAQSVIRHELKMDPTVKRQGYGLVNDGSGRAFGTTVVPGTLLPDAPTPFVPPDNA